MKKGKIIGGALSCLMLCGLLVGCSSNTDSSEGNTQSTTSSTVQPFQKMTLRQQQYRMKREPLQKQNLPANGWG